ncbi:hypothetical protein [Azomonas macrocytogenes]|uniref:Uncharacterized protein YcfJ n=1 Tax=Azomonas macrocytogenes TaxID=69962 RepID=A0A839T4C9_AZOMA|nr:hypothetical protein [Azomonas macrocytogenes]MBB3103346.1 uncharacterized protein YcfJ [Azomonas macrocytogenes]
MKKFAHLSLYMFLAGSVTANAAEIMMEKEDTSIGKGYGALSTMMLGAAAGGPIGAVAGSVAGFFAGGETQKAVGGSQKAYIVRTEDNRDVWIRSPNREYQIGQDVDVVRGRIQPQIN